MEETFSAERYLQELANELIAKFSFAGSATTPGLVGAAREHEVRSKLGMLLPSQMHISTGCGIDSYGATSRQLDVIVHERDNCPVFSLSGSADAVYLPCESIAAAGEIKSALGKKELEDAVDSIRSIKSLRRSIENRRHFRRYGSSLITAGSEEERYDQNKKLRDQIYGFVLCQRFATKPATLAEHYAKACQSDEPAHSPAMLISLEDGIMMFVDRSGRLARNSVDAQEIVHFHHPGGDFQYLLSEIIDICQTGRTTDSLPSSLYVLGRHRNSPVNVHQRFTLSSTPLSDST